MSFVVAPIVEGYGDVVAVPLLLRRMAPTLAIARPVRFPRTRLVQNEHLVRAARIANANIAQHGAILLVIDAESDCAAKLGPMLQQQIHAALPNRLCRAALAVRGFEAWIAGGDPAYGLDDADHAGDLKARIKATEGVYRKTVDQPKLVARADLERLARVSRSFRRLQDVVDEFLAFSA